MSADSQDTKGSILSTGQLLTAEDVAREFQLCQSTVEDLARRGVIPSIRLGRARRFVRTRLEEWITEQLNANGGAGDERP